MARPTTSSWLPLLSDAALRQLSGPAVFARGQTYAASGAIETLEDAEPAPGEQVALAAVVQGTQPYQVRVWIDEENDLDGECDCPHAQDGNFCKHLVALCLAWRGDLGGEAPAPDAQAARKVAAVAKRARTQASNRDALHAFVRAQPAQALAERLWAWAGYDRALMADLKAWQAEHSAGNDTKALRGAIGDLLRQRSGYLDWHEMPTYMRRAGRVLPLLQPWLQRDPAELRALCEHALRCLYKVAEHADDSNGELGGLMQDLIALLTQALHAAPPPAAWVERWFTLMAEDPWGLWDEKAILAAAGPAVLARYTERVREEWDRWQRSHPATGRYDYQRSQLRGRYLARRATRARCAMPWPPAPPTRTNSMTSWPCAKARAGTARPSSGRRRRPNAIRRTGAARTTCCVATSATAGTRKPWPSGAAAWRPTPRRTSTSPH